MNFTKTEIFNFFEQKISKTAIKQCDDEWRVVGKWCYVALMENGWIDVWICNPKDLTNGLGQRKVNNIDSRLNPSMYERVERANGENWYQTRDKNFVLLNLGIFGIRKKKQMSPEFMFKQAERLREYRDLKLEANPT